MQDLEINEIVKQALQRAYEFFTVEDYRNAEEIYRQILRVDQTNIDAIQMLVLAACKNGNYDEAIHFAEYGLELQPDNHQLWNNLGLVKSTSHKCNEAIACFQRAIELKPDEPHLYTNLAIEHKKNGYTAKAEEIFKEATAKNSEHAWFNYGAFLHEMGELERAIQLYKKAILINNDLAVAHYNLATCYLLLGDPRGWDEYEWRWQHQKRFCAIRDKHKGNYWRGEETKSISIYCEQGVGDHLMFVRYYDHLKQLIPKVVVECDESLRSLYVNSGIEVGNEETESHCSVMSLPKILGVVPPKKFSHSMPVNNEFWNMFKTYLKVGITWAGSPIHANDSNRSTTLSMFQPLSELENVKLFSLQKDHWLRRDGSDPTMGACFKVVDLKEHMHSWECTAGIVDNLDLIISVDTAVAHLAASMGKEVWLILPQMPDWRWGLAGEQTEWYPTMKLYRREDGDYRRIFAQLARNLQDRLNR